MHSSGQTWMNTGLPGYCNKGIPVPRVLCHNLTEVTKVPGKGMGILQHLQKFRVRVRKWYRTHRSSGYCGTGVLSLQKFRVRVWMSCRTYRSSGYGHECPTKLTQVLCRVIPGVNTPAMVLYVPYRTQRLKFPLMVEVEVSIASIICRLYDHIRWKLPYTPVYFHLLPRVSQTCSCFRKTSVRVHQVPFDLLPWKFLSINFHGSKLKVDLLPWKLMEVDLLP